MELKVPSERVAVKDEGLPSSEESGSNEEYSLKCLAGGLEK